MKAKVVSDKLGKLRGRMFVFCMKTNVLNVSSVLQNEPLGARGAGSEWTD